MGKRITSLQEITTVTDNDFIPVDNQSSGVRKLSAGFLNDIEDALDGKQDALTAGANIEIAQDGTISATDTTYTAGTNVDITNGVISATDTNTDALSELTDTAISSPSDGDALVYDSTSGKWVNGGVASDIGDLNDVDITSPSNGQVLSYNSTSQEWENTTPSAGSSVSVTQVQSTGTKIATVTVDNVDTDLYAPTPTEVVANPSGTGSTDLTKIDVGGTIYNIPTGGSGSSTLAGLTDVDLNTPTDGQGLVYDATNQKWVNGNVGGGSGGSGYEETVLWDDILTPDTSGSDITLSDAVTNYDQLLFVLKPANSTEITYAYFPVSELEVSGTYGIIAIGGYSTYAYFTYNSATSLNIKSWASADKTQYQKIIGIKFGSGSGGGGSSIIDEIWTGNETPPTTGTVITLTEKWNDYDFLCFLVTNTTASDAPYSTPIIMTKDMAIDTKNLQAAYSYNRFDVVVTPKSDTTLQIERPSSNGTAVIYKKIYGIKLGSGGSSGGGNLYGTTDPTLDLGSNGDIYMKYQGGSEPVEGETETLTNVYLEITRGNDWVALPNFDASLYYSVIFNHGVNPQLSTKINISDISTDANNPTIFGNTYDDLYGYINNSTLYLKTVTWNSVINSAIVTLNVFQPPQILNVFGKVEDEWVGFPEEGYEETTLWEGSQSITRYDTPFTIPDIGMSELNEYDAFAFDFYSSYNIPRFGIMLTSYIKTHQKANITLESNPVDSAYSLFIYYDSVNDILKAVATTNYGYTLTKVIGIKYGNGGSGANSSTSLYKWYTSNDGIITVRTGPDGTYWFFNGFNTDGGGSTFVNIPSELAQFAPTNTDVQLSEAYTNPSEPTVGWIGFYAGTIRGWNVAKSANLFTTLYGVVKADGANTQHNGYYNAYTGIPNSGGVSYSTAEQVVGTWIDGKPIYELTIAKAVNFPGSNTWKTLGIAMSTYNIKQIFDVAIVGTENTNNVPALLHPESVEPINGDICVYHNFNWDMTSSHIILRYSKTTD